MPRRSEPKVVEADADDAPIDLGADEVGLDDDIEEDELDPEVLDDELVEVIGEEIGDVAIDNAVVDEGDDLDVALVSDVSRATEESDDEEDDTVLDEDVEASLDVILKERLVVEDEVDDEEVPDTDERGDVTESVMVRQPDEFVCRSCFLVKHPSQLADKKKVLCRDCV